MVDLFSAARRSSIAKTLNINVSEIATLRADFTAEYWRLGLCGTEIVRLYHKRMQLLREVEVELREGLIATPNLCKRRLQLHWCAGWEILKDLDNRYAITLTDAIVKFLIPRVLYFCQMQLVQEFPGHLPVWWEPDLIPRNILMYISKECTDSRELWEPYVAALKLQGMSDVFDTSHKYQSPRQCNIEYDSERNIVTGVVPQQPDLPALHERKKR